MPLSSRVYSAPRTGALPALARTTSSASKKKKKWGDGYASSCSDPDMDCEAIANDDPDGVKAKDYCDAKSDATKKFGVVSSLFAGLCRWGCMVGYNRCLSEIPLYEDILGSGGNGRDDP